MAKAEDQQLERWVHRALLAGIVLSGSLLAIGLTVNLASGARGVPGPPSALPALLGSAIRGDGVALIDLGLLALIGTPVVRVMVLAVGWLLRRDFRLAAVAGAVLVLLGLGMALGLG